MQSTSPNSGPVILSGGYKGIFIHNINPLESEEILLTWEVINEVYYRNSKLVIKYVDSCKKVNTQEKYSQYNFNSLCNLESETHVRIGSSKDYLEDCTGSPWVFQV